MFRCGSRISGLSSNYFIFSQPRREIQTSSSLSGNTLKMNRLLKKAMQKETSSLNNAVVGLDDYVRKVDYRSIKLL